VTAFRNLDGSMVVELLNLATVGTSLAFGTDTRIGRVTTYLTDETHSVERVTDARHPGSRQVTVALPARSLTTLVLR
jgi:glucosylceramidase